MKHHMRYTSNIQRNIFRNILHTLLALVLIVSGIFVFDTKSASAACTPNTANLGSVTGSFSVASAGTYRVWSRIQPDATNAANNSYTLEVDGTTCNVTVGDANLTAGQWTWVDYRDATTTSKINLTLSAGTHTYAMYGREANVLVDRVIFASNPACVPTGTGDNCASELYDTAAPSVSVTAPAANATVSNTTTVSATATDDVAVNSVGFFLDGSSTAFATDNTAPFSISWVTSAAANGVHTITAKATDSSGNVGTSTGVSVTVSNTTPDTTAPTTSITSPTAGQTVSGTVVVNATSADNVGVIRTELYRDGVLIGTDSSAPFSFSWDTTTTTNASHSLQTRAYDTAGNGPGVSTSVSVTVNNTVVTPKAGDVNGDNSVNAFDLSIVLSNWNRTGRTRTQGDLTGDGTTNVFDLSVVLSKWGS